MGRIALVVALLLAGCMTRFEGRVGPSPREVFIPPVPPSTQKNVTVTIDTSERDNRRN